MVMVGEGNRVVTQHKLGDHDQAEAEAEAEAVVGAQDDPCQIDCG